MKTAIAYASAFALVALLNGVNAIQVCTPNDTKMDDCNSCFCIGDGSGWACTIMECIHREVVVKDPASAVEVQADQPERAKRDTELEVLPTPCSPGELRPLDCNTCFCLPDGSGWGCTLVGCLPKHSTMHSRLGR